MKKLVTYFLAAIMVFALIACVAQPAVQTDPTAEDTEPSVSQTQPNSDPTEPDVAASVPVDTTPQETLPGLTMPEVGEDQGNFGPIF